MAKSKSNSRYDTSLNVDLIPSGPAGEQSMWCISITSLDFPEDNKITLLASEDQQLVDLHELIDEFITYDKNDTYKAELADLLESLARKIRGSLKGKD